MTRSSFALTVADEMNRLLERSFTEPAGRGILVGLSGGPDSVALLLAAATWARDHGRDLMAAHLNHGLRSNDSETDEAFCVDLCERLEIPLHLHREDPRAAARQRGLGLEEAARHLRRRFFDSILDHHPELACVATGHHRDDQTETVLMRMFRGTGPEGLAGIRPVAGRTIHPLLAFSRSDILAFLERKGQPWRLDSSNLEGDNTRARLRRELMPLAREIFGTGCDRSPARLAELLDGDLEILELVTDQRLAEMAISDTEGNALLVSRLTGLQPALARRVLWRWLALERSEGALDLEKVHVENIMGWLREGTSGSQFDLPGAGVLHRNFDHLRFRGENFTTIPLRSAADYRILVARATLSADLVEQGRQEGAGDTHPAKDLEVDGPWNLTCPASVLQGNLRIRNWRAGDRFQPFGLDGSRKLSDLLREKKIPADQRESVLIVEDEGGILWVVGLARAERTRLLPSCTQAVTLSVIERNNEFFE